MRIVRQAIWEPCSKEEFDSAMKGFLGIGYRVVPIYNGGGGIMDQLRRAPDGYRYEKCVGYKDVVLLTSAEANDKELMKQLNQWDKKRH